MRTILEVSKAEMTKEVIELMWSRLRLDGWSGVWKKSRRCWGQTGTAIKENWGQALMAGFVYSHHW